MQRRSSAFLVCPIEQLKGDLDCAPFKISNTQPIPDHAQIGLMQFRAETVVELV